MKTYDELYDDIKGALDDGYVLGHAEGWNGGAYHAYRYVMDRLEEIREAEEKQTKSEVTLTTLLDKIENLDRTLSETYLAMCEMEQNAKKARNGWI